VAWALDSGGYSEIRQHGRWTLEPAAFVDQVRAIADRVGLMAWAAPQDWMVEPDALAATGLTVEDHQARTVDNYAQVVDAAPEIPWIPVLQGWTVAQYVACLERYRAAGVDLERADLVGVGTLCRRDAAHDVARIVLELADAGLTLHGFGVKADALALVGPWLASADSLAWSFTGRDTRPCPHTGAASCSNCLPHALAWRARTLARIATHYQPALFG
jgi:hypothetical protein